MDLSRFEPLIPVIPIALCILFTILLFRRGAKKIIRLQKSLYEGRHEFRDVSPSEFPFLDLGFYDSKRDRLEKQGFRHMGDIEDVTAQKAVPSVKAFIRVMLSGDGAIVAGIYHARMFGRMRFMQSLGALTPDDKMKVVDFETEFTNGLFLVTSNTEGTDRTGDVKGIVRIQRPPETPLEQIYRLHLDNLGDILEKYPDMQPVRLSNMKDIMESSHRIQEMKNAHKRSIGYMNAEELKRIATPSLKGVADLTAREIERLKREEKGELPNPRGKQPG